MKDSKLNGEEAKYWREWMEANPERKLWRGQVLAALRAVEEMQDILEGMVYNYDQSGFVDESWWDAARQVAKSTAETS